MVTTENVPFESFLRTLRSMADSGRVGLLAERVATRSLQRGIGPDNYTVDIQARGRKGAWRSLSGISALCRNVAGYSLVTGK